MKKLKILSVIFTIGLYKEAFLERPLEILTIRGFKSIKDLDKFRLRNLNVFIGGNGAGKSNLIEFFRMISAMIKPDGLREFIAGSADSYLFGGPKVTPNIYVNLFFDLNGYEFQLAPTEDGFFLINDEKRHFHGLGGTETRNFRSGSFTSSLIDELHDEATKHTYETIQSWKIYHFHDTSKEAGMRRLCDEAYNDKLYTDALNIAPFLLHLKEDHPEQYREIVSSIQLVVPFFDDFILKSNKNEKLRLDWKQKGLNDFPMRPTQLSDGSIRFICLATALLQPNPPATIIIDEPELGLHPAAISILAELIQDAAKRTQVIIATQSPALIDNFEVKDIIAVNRKNGASTFTRLNEKDFSMWLEDYSVGELWTKSVITGGPTYE